MKKRVGTLLALAALFTTSSHAQPVPFAVAPSGEVVVLSPGHPSLKAWHISAATKVAPPAGNETTPERAALGRQLFHDARVSVHGRTSCASCHDSARGFADGVPGSVRFMGEVMTRNSPSIFDVAYRPFLMWDGRNVAKDGLGAAEHQAISSQSLTGSLSAGSFEAGLIDKDTPHAEFANAGVARIRELEGYRRQFDRAYPGEVIDQKTIGKAIAAYERSVVSEGTRFDRFVAGETNLTRQEIDGLRIFIDRDKGNCSVCHQAPLFTDNGFHNIGVNSPDAGRYDAKDPRRKQEALKGAFLTPPLRQVANTAPYFHDGSARTLLDVVKHYQRGGVLKTNLDANIRPLPLTSEDMEALVAFMGTLTSPQEVYDQHDRPQLPKR